MRHKATVKATDQSDVPTETHTSKAAGSRAGSDCTPESGSESDAGSRGGRIYRHFLAEIYCSAAHTLERKGWGDLPCLLPTESGLPQDKSLPQSMHPGVWKVAGLDSVMGLKNLQAKVL